MTPAPPKLFDRQLHRRNRDRSAAGFNDYAFLKTRESSHLIERLEDVSRTFDRALDLGAHDGALTKLLAAHDQVTSIEAGDTSEAFVSQMLADGLKARLLDEEHLELPQATYDLVTSVLSLHWVNDLPGTLIQIRNALKPDGLFLGCLFGAGTLAELRTSLIEAESELSGGVSPRISPLPGLQDMAGLMQRAGFALPVVDLETVTVRYGDRALRMLTDSGVTARRASPCHGDCWRGWPRFMRSAFQTLMGGCARHSMWSGCRAGRRMQASPSL